ACEPDCNTNQLVDACEISAGTSPDCNTNLLPDDCDVNAFASGAVDMTGGTYILVGSFTDPRQGFVVADDFDLSSAKTISGVQIFGFFSAPGAAASIADDSFIVKIWSNAGTNAPNAVEYADFVPSA